MSSSTFGNAAIGGGGGATRALIGGLTPPALGTGGGTMTLGFAAAHGARCGAGGRLANLDGEGERGNLDGDADRPFALFARGGKDVLLVGDLGGR